MNRVLIACLILIGLSSCDKYLSREPVDRVYPQSVEEFGDLLVDAQVGNYHGFVDLMSDDIRAYNYSAVNDPTLYQTWQVAYLWSDQDDDSNWFNPQRAWEFHYTDIYKCNVVLEGVYDAPGDKDLADHIYGEALITRAYNHFMLVNLFARHYDSNTANVDLGVPLALNAVTAGIHHYARNTVQEVYDQCEQDILEGLALINDRLIDQPKYHFSTINSQAFLSRLYLYQERWEDVVEASTAVLAQNDNVMPLKKMYVDGIDNVYTFSDYYFDANNDNILMTGRRSFTLNRVNSGYYAGDFRDEFLKFVVPNFGNLLFDFRGNNYVQTNAANPNWTTCKYSLSWTQPGHPIFRVEEVILNRAEAYANLFKEKQDFQSKINAVTDINSIATKRYWLYKTQEDFYGFDDSDFDSNTLLLHVKDERKRELCSESHRWFDLKRDGYPSFVHHFEGQERRMVKNDDRYVLQIPMSELQTNNLIEPNPRVNVGN